MVLADEVLDAQGNVLLPRGTVLTDDQLASLARHGIAALAVHDAVGDRLDRLFRKLDPDSADAWATRELRQYLAAWRHGGAR
ncbi:hypothetical protein GO485_11675 [Pseudoduganella flava]|nr:hypothetical protein GO485_11675 [Pseudoduganella flava]